MQAMKTGALIQAAVLCGAQAGDWDRLGDGARGGLAAYAKLPLTGMRLRSNTPFR